MKNRRENNDELSIRECDILKSLNKEAFISQRVLSEVTGHCIGVVNRSIRDLIVKEYLDEEIILTQKAKTLFENRKPENAIILAAGLGMRMVPINYSVPKAFLEVGGEKLIERLIKQLHDVGVNDITIVVGFMKEYFEYLIDEYGVDLVVNENYVRKNNLHSLELVHNRLANTYIIPCDIWCESNPFSSTELYSWYMVSDHIDEESTVRVNRKKELVKVGNHGYGSKMIGISYLLEKDANVIKERISELCSDKINDESFWEVSLFKEDKMIIPARVVKGKSVVEINTYEQLRELDSDSTQLKSDEIRTIAEVMNCGEKDIEEITVLKKGMTNRSFLFSANGEKFIMRIPGEGTDQLINRKQETEVFRTISGLGLCDDPVYINSDNGYKITRYLDGVRTCDSHNEEDLKRCMKKLRSFHELHLSVSHSFDIFAQIEFYEKLWGENSSVYRDYQKTKENVMSLHCFIDDIDKDWCLTHIDAVPDNFLFYTAENRSEELQLTDWEYSGMQDPHVDIAMFCIYSLYDKDHIDRLIDIYFEDKCDKKIRTKIYCYISMCGLLWSNWCEYKRQLGIEFGEYSLCQYRYAKEYYKYASRLISEMEQEKR